MQKVVGSNPISRFSRNPALGRDFVVQAGANGKSNHPLISPEGKGGKEWGDVACRRRRGVGGSVRGIALGLAQVRAGSPFAPGEMPNRVNRC